MILKFKKEYTINASADDISRFLRDLNEVINCIPYLEDVNIDIPSRFRARVRLPYSFIKGRFKIEGEILESEKERLSVNLQGSSIGSSFKVALMISISSMKIDIDVTIEIYGLLSHLSKSLIQRVIEDIEAHMLRCIKERLEAV